MKSVTVGIGEHKVSAKSDETLKTYGLGSCVAVVLYDRVQRIAGMLHVAYPESTVNGKKAGKLPGYFVDTGIPLFIEEIKQHNVERRNVWAKLIGGSALMDDNGRFNIGKRNVLAVRKALWNAGIGVLKEDTGESISRTVSIAVATGVVTVSSGDSSWDL